AGRRGEQYSCSWLPGLVISAVRGALCSSAEGGDCHGLGGLARLSWGPWRLSLAPVVLLMQGTEPLEGTPRNSHRKLETVLNHLLEPHAIKDYCANGLQVEGRARIRKVVTGVTASQALIDAAVALDADAILVHHGYFWSGEPAQITGMKQRRLK